MKFTQIFAILKNMLSTECDMSIIQNLPTVPHTSRFSIPRGLEIGADILLSIKRIFWGKKKSQSFTPLYFEF